MRIRNLLAAAAAGIALAVFAGPTWAQTAKAQMKDKDGKDVGTVTLTQAPKGVLLKAELAGLPPGPHAFHIHAVGKCEPPFTSAGGHFNPKGKKHGLLAEGGFHAGDMPNIHVGADGALTIEVFSESVTLAKGKAKSVFDADGSAIVIHAGADDYKSDPAGEAGPRIACGVIQ